MNYYAHERDTLIDDLPGEEINIGQQLSMDELLDLDRMAIKEAMGKMDLLSTIILNLRFWHDYPLDHIADDLNLCYMQVERLYFKALHDLKDFLKIEFPAKKIH